MRYFIHLAYKGTYFHGWQYQPNASSIQETLSKALSMILQQTVEITGAGRTDTGVHAKEMYAHFDCELNLEPNRLVHKLNSFLALDIVVYNIFEVKPTAHARFDAIKRTYEYHINTVKSPFLVGLSCYLSKSLDVEAMNKAAMLLLEHKDFQCFSKVNTDVATFNCDISEAYWEQKNDQLVFTISADRFLRNMVRAIVGTMVLVGSHKITHTDFLKILESKDRSKAGFSAPAHGLYLTKIIYDFKNIQL